MSVPTPDATTAEPTADIAVEPTKPTETVEFWKTKAREQEARAKSNKTAADELAAIKEAQLSESDKVQARISKAEAEAAAVPARVAEALKAHLIGLHSIDSEDAELFLTATEPELLLKQVGRLTGREADRKKQGNHVPREGNTPKAGSDEARATARSLFASGN